MFGNIIRQNLIKTYTKTHQIALFFLTFSWCMPTYPHSKRAAIISLFLYENDHFLYQLLSNYTSKCISLVAYFLRKLNAP